MSGEKEAAWFAESENLFVRQNLTIKEIAGALPPCENTLYKWKIKGGWDEKRRAHQTSPRDLAELMRASLHVYLKRLEANAEDGILDNATFDAINKAVAAIKGVERQGADIRVMAVEVMRRYTDFLKGEEISAGELQMHSERIRGWFASLE
jgi:transposase-like protein